MDYIQTYDRFKGKGTQKLLNNGVNETSTVLDKDYVRTKPCFSMNKGVFIDYNGGMTICCDMLPNYIINGKLAI